MTSLKSIAAGAVALTLVTVPADAMSKYKWKYRPVVVLAGPGGQAQLEQQRRIFAAHRKGLIERNIVVVWVAGKPVDAELGPGPGLTASQLRARYAKSKGAFRVVLVGKDGGTKLVRTKPVGVSTLFQTIDAMPMRRDEMRRQR